MRTSPADRRRLVGKPFGIRLALVLIPAALFAASCGSSSESTDQAQSTTTATTTSAATTEEGVGVSSQEGAEKGPGGYGFDRSDPEGGIANIMESFATDKATATCIHEAWGDVANVSPAELTPELMTYEICGTSIFQMMTGDGRFTGADG